jgi:hypothetical protein
MLPRPPCVADESCVEAQVLDLDGAAAHRMVCGALHMMQAARVATCEAHNSSARSLIALVFDVLHAALVSTSCMGACAMQTMCHEPVHIDRCVLQSSRLWLALRRNMRTVERSRSRRSTYC